MSKRTLFFIFYIMLSCQFSQVSTCSLNPRKCPDIPVDPVCGVDLRTYTNECKMKEQLCDVTSHPVMLYHGFCQGCASYKTISAIFVSTFFSRNGTCSNYGKINHKNIRKCIKKLFVTSLKTDYPLYLKIKHFIALFPAQQFSSKRMRKCLRKVHEICDTNDDFVLSRKELFQCIVEKTPRFPDARTRHSEKADVSTGTVCLASICYCADAQGNIVTHFPVVKKKLYNCTKIVAKWKMDGLLKTSKNHIDKCDDVTTRYNYTVHVIQEYMQEKRSIMRYLSRETLSMRTVNKILSWKFRQHDTNENNALDVNEQNSVLKDSHGVDSSCLKILLQKCNQDKNQELSRREWRHCFGFKQEGKNVLIEVKNKLSTGLRCDPVRVCVLSCAAGFARDTNGCLVCKCRAFSKYVDGWKRGLD